MQGYIYSAISFLAMVIHPIINFDMLPGRRRSSTPYGLSYRWFLASVFAYYATDACWGVFAGLEWTRALYADTVAYFIALSVSVIAWCRYVIVYIDSSRRMRKALFAAGYGLLGMNIVLLAANFPTGCIFGFDAAGAYVPGPLRSLVFVPLVVLNALMAVFALVKALGGQDAARRRNMVVFLFCVTMAAAIVMQIAWPLWPFYAIGCLVGSCFFHVFVVEDELAELRRAVIVREEAAKHAAEVENAQERVRAAEKARSMFFGIVSHDIRTPLNAILGYAELLQLGVDGREGRDEALDAIRKGGTTLLQLVNDVLDISKIDAGELELKPEPVELSAMVDEVLSQFKAAAAEKGVALDNLAAGVPTVLLDAHRFRQILLNLVGNAVKFTECGKIAVAAACSGTGIELSVSDTGCGIPKDMLLHIFDPFVQVGDPTHSADRAGGTGLGLSICRRLVEAMGGTLDAKSEPGKGSTFWARIPGVLATAEKPSAPAAPQPAAKRLPKRVLVVDDSPINREVLSSLLVHAGVADVRHARDGAEAFSVIAAASRTDNAYDAVFTDLWMPNMNGVELVEKLRADSRFRRLPVHAVTADAEFLRDGKSRLFTGIILKPISYGKLIEAFESAMG